MGDQFIPIPSATAGYNVRTQEFIVSATTVQVHYFIVQDVAGAVASCTTDALGVGLNAHITNLTIEKSVPSAIGSLVVMAGFSDGTNAQFARVDSLGNQREVGTWADGSSAGTADKLQVLPVRANAAAPTLTESFAHMLSSDLSGNLRVNVNNAVSGVVSVSGVVNTSGTVNNSVSAVVSVSGTVNTSGTVNNAVSAVVSVSGPVAVTNSAIASVNSATPGFAVYTGGNDGTNIRAFKVDTAGVLAVTATVNNALSGVVSTSGTVSCSVNNAVSAVVSVSGTVAVTEADLDNAIATTTSAIPPQAMQVAYSDGTNLYPGIAISSAIVASANTQTRGVQAVGPLIQWIRVASAAANAKASAVRTAITGAYNVITGYSFGLGCGIASSTADAVNIIHGPTATAVVFAQYSARCPASTGREFTNNNITWVASLFTAVGIEFSASAPASGFQYCSIWGYTLPS